MPGALYKLSANVPPPPSPSTTSPVTLSGPSLRIPNSSNNLQVDASSMIFSAAVVIYALSLFSCSRALSINVRRDDCPLACPETDADKNGLSKFSIDDATISCSYVGKPDNSCTYDMVSVDSSAL